MQALNPRVAVRTDKEDIEQKPDAYFEQFDIVCVTYASLPTLVCSHRNNSVFVMSTELTVDHHRLDWMLSAELKKSLSTPQIRLECLAIFSVISIVITIFSKL